MHTHPVILLKPVFHFLDEIIRNYGLYIYMGMVWLSPFLIVWILSGGFWRRPPRRRRIRKVTPTITRTKATPPPLPPILERKPGDGADEDIQAFAI